MTKKFLSEIIKTAAVAAVMAAMLLFAGCSDGSGTPAAVPFSEAIDGEGASIWYECQNKAGTSDSTDIFAEEAEPSASDNQFGRETRVVWVKVYKDGKLSTYTCKKNVYLGYFAKMTDDEVLEALETDKERFVCGQKDEKYNIYIYSDATGHVIMYEGVPSIIRTGVDDTVVDEDGKEKTLDEIPMYFMTLMSSDSVATFQIYDSYYGGYTLYNYDETPFGSACMVTRCDEGTVFGMDDLDLEGAVVDYDTPEDLLYELNEPFRKQREERAKKYSSKESEGTASSDGDFSF